VTPQSGNQVSTSLGNSGLCWTVFARNRDTAVPAEGNGNLQTLICVLVARPRRCLTLSNPVPWQNWMVAYLGYTLRMRTLFRGWPIMVNDTHTRRRRLLIERGRLKMQDRKMTEQRHINRRKNWGKCRTGKWLTKSQGLKMQDRKMMVQIAKPENAGPENAGLKNDRLEFDGPEQCAVMSLHWSRSIMYTLKTVSISSCRQTYFETVIFLPWFVHACFSMVISDLCFCLTYIIRICWWSWQKRVIS